MFIRFVVANRDPSSLVRQGIFQVAYRVMESVEIRDYQRKELRRVLDWFGKHLDSPKSFAKSRYPRAQNKAISWYRDCAVEHIAKMHELVAVLNDLGIQTEMIRTENPGYIVYEDKFQVVAEHFRDTGA